MASWVVATLLAAVCAVSPTENPHPTVIGPITGEHPAWLIDGSAGRWAGGDQVVKTLWVLSRKASGSLHVQGRRLDGPGTLMFQDGMDGQPTDTLTIANPWHRSVMPGGASADILGSYSFIPNYVIYPSPGCWELTVDLGADKTRIVLDIK